MLYRILLLHGTIYCLILNICVSRYVQYRDVTIPWNDTHYHIVRLAHRALEDYIIPHIIIQYHILLCIPTSPWADVV